MASGQDQAPSNPASRRLGPQSQDGESPPQARGTAAGDTDHPALQRAEELVDHIGERIGYFTHMLGHRLRKASARAREELQDIWAEAQHIRTRGRS